MGKKVVLLGLYNGQKLEGEPLSDLTMYMRVMGQEDEGQQAGSRHEGEEREGEGSTFVRVLLLRGRLQGAVLIGETGLEETFENLILDGLDLSQYGPALLDPDIELDHMFD